MEREHLLQLIYGVTIIALTVLAGFLIRKILRYQKNRLLRKHKGNQIEEQIETQFIMIERLVLPIVLFIGLAVLFMFFKRLRGLGATFLASAGIYGIVVGFAAK
ncbi:MAG: hypothetical protein ACE5PV_10165 [Candidatus Poribacteria bacterium]